MGLFLVKKAENFRVPRTLPREAQTGGADSTQHIAERLI
jgi:hypothetical protein